jgi:colicin import membrane protein
MKRKSTPYYQRPFILSLLLHIVLFLLVFLSPFTASSQEKAHKISAGGKAFEKNENLPPIKATSIESKKVEAEIKKIKAKAQKEAEVKRQEALKLKKAKQDYLKIQAEQKKIKKQVEQQKRKAAIERKKAAQAKKEVEQLKRKKAQEAAALKKKQKDLEQLKKKREAEAAALKKKREAESKKVDLEPPRPLGKNTSQVVDPSEMNRYNLLIKNSIEELWIVPNNVDKNAFCKLMIRLAPGGAVLNVKLIESSGNSALDQSALTAVKQASPLPIPTDPALFETFKEIHLTLNPRDL